MKDRLCVFPMWRFIGLWVLGHINVRDRGDWDMKASGYTRHMPVGWERQSEELLVGSADCKLLYLG